MRSFLALMLAALAGLPGTSPAQVVPDVGLATAVSRVGAVTTVSGGTRVGGNLFQGFTRFDVQTGTLVNFSAPAGVDRIIGRVTSEGASFVDGRLASPVSLFLFNPKGWMFGAGASLNVQGSFAVSSADYVKLGTDGRFDATEPSRSALTASAPSEFGFLGPTPAPISLSGSLLVARTGASLSLVGGDLLLSGGRLSAPGGHIELTSVQGGTIHASGTLISADSPGAGVASGSIAIRGGRLVLDQKASVQSVNLAPGLGGAVAADLLADVTLDDSSISTRTAGLGPGGDLVLTAGSLALLNGAQVDTATLGAGNGGALSAVTRGAVTLSSGSALLSIALAAGDAGRISVQSDVLAVDGAAISARTYAAGNAGSIDLAVGQLSLTGAAQVDATTLGHGRGGDLRVSASRQIFISGFDAANPLVRSGLFASAEMDPAFTRGPANGAAGSIHVVTPLLALADRGFISGGSFAPAAGAGGSVVIEAGRVVLASGGEIGSRSTGAGLAGSLSILATSLELYGGLISTQTTIANGGDIAISARDLVYLRDSAITTSVAGGLGDGGNITIDPQFVVLDHSQIIANAFQGRGGNISIVADNFLNQAGLVQASSQLGLPGTITIQSPRVDVSGALRVLSSDYLDASRLIRASCAARAHQASSTFIAGQRGGLAQRPDSGQELAERRPVAVGCGPLQGMAPVLDAPAARDHHVAN